MIYSNHLAFENEREVTTNLTNIPGDKRTDVFGAGYLQITDDDPQGTCMDGTI